MNNNKELALKILTEKTAYVFCGGGVLGIAHVGALCRLYELGGLRNIKSVTGSSIGSVVASALACGATTDYLKSKMSNVNLNKFKDGNGLICMFFRFLFKYGLYKGDQVTLFIKEVIRDLTGDENTTFLNNYNKTGIHLTTTYLSMKQQKTLYIDHNNEPDLSIAKASKWSSTMPAFFKAEKIYKSGRLFDCAIDGGTIDNYPLHLAREQGYKSSEIISI
jgi:predicted acylesterase/phospholipase RssA